MWMAEHLIEDTYSMRLKPMTIRPDMNPQDRLLTDLIVHVAIIMQYNNSMEILTPFIQMINDPKKLKVSCRIVVYALNIFVRQCTYLPCLRINFP